MGGEPVKENFGEVVMKNRTMTSGTVRVLAAATLVAAGALGATLIVGVILFAIAVLRPALAVWTGGPDGSGMWWSTAAGWRLMAGPLAAALAGSALLGALVALTLRAPAGWSSLRLQWSAYRTWLESHQR